MSSTTPACPDAHSAPPDRGSCAASSWGWCGTVTA
jgi:hypothetical protein